MNIQNFKEHLKQANLPDNLTDGFECRANKLWFDANPDLDIIINFWQQQIINQTFSFVVYGAGTLIEKIFNTIPQVHYNSSLVAFVDMKAGSRDFSHFPAPVLPLHVLNTLSYDKLILCHPFAEQDMYEKACQLGIIDSNIIQVYTSKTLQDWQQQCLEKTIALQQQRIEKTKKKLPPDKKTLVYINANGPVIIHPKILKACNEPAFNIFHCHLSVLGHMVPSTTDCDYDFDCGSSLGLCIAIISTINPDVIYVNDNGLLKYQIAPLIKLFFDQKIFIYEPYDTIASIYSDASTLQAIDMTAKDIDYSLATEAYLFEQSNGVIHNDNGLPIHQLLKKHHTNHLHFHSYLGQEDIVFIDKNHFSTPIHLVFAGSVLPSNAAKEVHCDQMLLPFFKVLVSQGFKLTVYVSNAKDRTDLDDLFHEFLFFASKNPLFVIFPFTPRDHLIKKIASADFGLHLFPLPKNDSTRSAMYETSMASKIQTYIAAGLPIITGHFLKPIAKIVNDNQIGMAVNDEDINTLKEIVWNCDYQQLKQNVSLIQKQTTWQAHLAELETFLREICHS